MKTHRLFISGVWVSGSAPATELSNPYNGARLAQVEQADENQIESSLVSAQKTFAVFRSTSRYMRSRLLLEMARGISERRAELTELIVSEAGKPRGTAQAEVDRAIVTFTLAAEETKRFGFGATLPLDIEPSGRSYAPAQTRKTPLGPILAITPFNFPLNLVAHKIAPALAVGASVILKPPPQAPGAGVCLAEIFEKAAQNVKDARESVPLGVFQVVHASNDLLEKAVVDPRIKVLSFTGSDRAGWMLKQKAFRKKTALELGGNAAVIIHSDADLERASNRCAYGAYAYSGQICISVQRVIVHESVQSEFTRLFIDKIAAIKTGDPSLEETSVGPLIDKKAADRVMEWIDAAVKSGATLLCGGKRSGNVITPALLSGVSHQAKLYTEEAFGPVALIESYREFSDAIALANDSRFGLQAGLFTDDQRLIRRAFDELEVGGVIVNDVPTFRADQMPYGGSKDSGEGREGVRYAMDDFCELRVLVNWTG